MIERWKVVVVCLPLVLVVTSSAAETLMPKFRTAQTQREKNECIRQCNGGYSSCIQPCYDFGSGYPNPGEAQRCQRACAEERVQCLSDC